jgi:hypothetical protein
MILGSALLQDDPEDGVDERPPPSPVGERIANARVEY